MTVGARWIERHFTLDRTWKGTDHAASLEPDGMRRLVRDLHDVADALRYKDDDLLPVEVEQRQKLSSDRWRDARALPGLIVRAPAELVGCRRPCCVTSRPYVIEDALRQRP